MWHSDPYLAPAGRLILIGMGLDNPLHMAILVLIVLLLFGAKRLPEMGRSLGSGMHEFRLGLLGRGEPAAMPREPSDSAAEGAGASERSA